MGTCNLKLENHSSSELPPLKLTSEPQTSEGRRWKKLCEKLAQQNYKQRAYIAYLHDAQESAQTKSSQYSLKPTINIKETELEVSAL